MFPDARFVHIHRNPFTVFQSTQRLYKTAVPRSYLQQPNQEQMNKSILHRYTTLYDAYCASRHLIPSGQFCEISFEQLEQDKVGQIHKIYKTLNLEGFAAFKPKLAAHVKSLDGYKKNQYPPLATPLHEEVARAWRKSIEEWGYAV
jgi:hypothetical protein